MAEYTSGVAKNVWFELQDLWTASNAFAFDLVSQEQPEDGADRIGIPSIADLTVNSDGSTDQTPDDPSTTDLELVVDIEPLILVDLKRRKLKQLLGGSDSWARQISRAAFPQMMNYLDKLLFDYVVDSLVFDTAAANTINVAGDAITYTDWLNAKSKVMSLNGADYNRLQWWVPPHQEAAIRLFTEFTSDRVPNDLAGEQQFGARMIGYLDAVPVYITNNTPGSSARGKKSFAVTQVDLTSNVLTFTFASHSFVPGQFISTVTTAGSASWTTADDAALGSAAITSVTATTITLPYTHADITAETPTVSVFADANYSLLWDAGHIHTARGDEMGVRMVPYEQRTGMAMQLSPLVGRIGRAGRAVSILAPYDSVS